jgi:CheY-like chemotaxis protein
VGTPVRRQASILVVEDDESAATFVTRVLERAGFVPSSVVDAEQATTLIEQKRFEVLITDLRLPGTNGLELIGSAREAQPDMAIVVITSHNEPGLEKRARSVGADEFLEKPFTASALVSVMRSLLAKQSAAESIETRPSRDDSKPPRTHAPGAPAETGKEPSTRPSAGYDSAGSGSTPPNWSRGNEPGAQGALCLLPSVEPGVRLLMSAPGSVPPISLWASGTPVFSRIVSTAALVCSPQTSAAWGPAR